MRALNVESECFARDRMLIERWSHADKKARMKDFDQVKVREALALGDIARDFVEMKLHHVGVGIGKRQGRANAAGGADRAEQIGVVVALVGGLPWPCSAPGPLPNLAVLLADAGLVFKPDFDRRRLGQAVEMSLQRAREVFLKASTVRSS